jgi:hypothetical protein
MKRNFSVVLALSALILTAGCKKSINSSVDLSAGAKASFASNAQWQTPTKTGRLTRYDIGDGHGSDCILSYDIGTGVVTLTQVLGTTSTTISPASIGFNTDNDGAVYVGTWNTDVTDNFNEIGGVHIIPYDANGTGHEDHILLYVPGHGLAYVLHYNVSTNLWHVDWTNDSGNHTSGSGIGGYDLMGLTDKIIAYDYGTGTKNYLICYRPGSKFVWIMHNNSLSSWTTVVQSSGGIGGFDMSNAYDQLVAIDYNPGAMDLVAYRPDYGFVWYIHHAAYSTNFTTGYSTRTGFPNFSFAYQQDRLIALNTSGNSLAEADNLMFCYRPGYGLSYSVVDDVSGSTWGGGAPYPGLAYSMFNDPYGAPPTYEGDHVLNFAGNTGYGNSSMLFYSNGGGNQSTICYLNPNTHTYTQVY